jgi:signal transduction histidine kinase
MKDANGLDQLLRLQDQRLARLARELHEGPHRRLSAALYHLDGYRLHAAAGSEDAWEEFDHGLDLLERGIRDTRNVINDLRPARLGEAGLAAAIEDLIHENVVAHGQLVAFSHNLAAESLPAGLATAVFRIVQEGLANVRLHSRSRKARLEIVSSEDSVQVEIEDWGVGFDPLAVPESCFGLEGMRARAALWGGRMRISSRPRIGTLVSVDIPLHDEPPAAARPVSESLLPAMEVHPLTTH